MPNWCRSILEFEGPENEIKEILKTDLDFEKICPTPKELLVDGRGDLSEDDPKKIQNIKKYGYADSHNWRIANWGVKWNPTSENKHKKITLTSPTKINATLITAWGLPLGILKKITLMYPQTIIKVIDYEDEGGWFVGSCTILNGSIMDNKIHEPSKEELRDRGMLCEEE